jgi:4-hydroxybutyrate CoA-transferase
MEAHFRHNTMFIGGNVRQAVNAGRKDYTPVFLSQVEDLFESEQTRIDVAVVRVAPRPLC